MSFFKSGKAFKGFKVFQEFESCFARWETRQRKGFHGGTRGRRKLCSSK